jgi:transcriptional regulator with XRE-family HTH domain
MSPPSTKDNATPELGKYLKDIRNSRGYSLRKVEQLTEGKISNGYLSQLENGEIARPSAVMLHRLAGAYGVDYAFLMERAGFVSESETPANRAATSVLGELTPDEEEQLLNFLGYLRSQKTKK